MATAKKVKINQKYIITKYMHYVLEQEKYPKSVYKFCKEIGITEEVFYSYYGSIESMKKGVWTTFYNETIKVIHKSKEYESFSSRDKMLTFFYSFFEILTLNRSYVLMSLKEHKDSLKNMEQLKDLRKKIKSFTAELIENDNENKSFKFTKNPTAIYSEGAWLQFLFLLKFWMEDDSAGFEKTDIAIEKSVRTIFDVFDNTPLSSVIDFGKFLWKEKV